MNIPEATKITGGLTNTSKMPCYSYGIPANQCKVGTQLRRKENTVCSKCYAHKSRYNFNTVQNAYHRRFYSVLDALGNNEEDKWIEAMIHLIDEYVELFDDTKYFRWHDSGDLLSLKHLEMIIEVVKGTPNIKHWIPTLEFGICIDYVKKHGKFSNIPNLVVRLSTPMIDGKPNEALAKRLGCQTSLVTRKKESFKAYKILEDVTKKMADEEKWVTTPADIGIALNIMEDKERLREIESSKNVCVSKMQDNSCMDCRKCWDTTQTNITYILH